MFGAELFLGSDPSAGGATVTFVDAFKVGANSSNYQPDFSGHGAAVGDLAVVTVQNGAGGAPAGWTALTSSSSSGAITKSYYKILDADDISSPDSFTGSATNACWACLYRGVSAVTEQQSISMGTTNTTTVFTGFTPGPGAQKIIMIACDVDSSTLGNPNGFWTTRLANFATLYRKYFLSEIDVSDYDDGGITHTFTGGGSFNQAAWLLVLE